MSDTHPQVGETYEVTPDSLTKGAAGAHQKVQILSGRFWTTKLPAYRWCELIAGHSQPARVTSSQARKLKPDCRHNDDAVSAADTYRKSE